MSITKRIYSKYADWDEYFPDMQVNLKVLPYDVSWNDLFSKLLDDPRLKLIENELNKTLEETGGKGHTTIYPLPNFVFNCFQKTKLSDVKVVILGQDPYFNNEDYKDRIVPQAHGLSFSVPKDFSIPPSLQNIFRNQKKFKWIDKTPDDGELVFWAKQGCLMMNTSLTVKNAQPNCHAHLWKWFTDEVITYISNKVDHVVFVLWGGEAFKKINLIDLDKHEVLISSHPSGFSADKPFRNYPSFNEFDHFGKINQKLLEFKKQPILWST